jgi:hypothetical protein
MAAVWLRFRTELRGHWWPLLGVALLVGRAGVVTLAAIAGARRTDTAFSRLLEQTHAADILVNPDNGTDSALQLGDIAALPQVAQVGRIDGLLVGPAKPRSFADFMALGIVAVSDGRAAYDLARPRVRAGRTPRRDRPNEVFVNEVLADRLGLAVGDRLPLTGFSLADGDVIDAASSDAEAQQAMDEIRRGELGQRINARVVGIGTFPDEIVVDQGFQNGGVYFGPAFSDRHPDVAVGFWGAMVRLRHGAADIPAFRAAVARLVPDEAIAFQSTAKTTTKVERAARPSVLALSVFAIVIGLTGLLVIGQALARQSFLDAADNDALGALGSTRRQLFAVTMLRAAVIAVIGGALAVVLAVLVSPLTPVGATRPAEPDPGLSVDTVVMGLGSVVVIGLVLLLAAVPAWRSAGLHDRDGALVRPSRVATAVTDLGLSVPASAGVRMALEPGRGRTAVRVRTTILSAGLALAVVVGAGVFAASLDHLVSTPRLFGWNWDTHVIVNSGLDAATVAAREQATALLDDSRAVARWGTLSLSDVTIDDAPMPAVGLDRAKGAVVPTLVDGALPRRDDQIALGRLTQHQLGVGIGDTVTARDNDGTEVPLEVVGTVVLPGLGTYPGSDKTSLGEGAVVTSDALRTLGPDFGRNDFFVQFADSATAAQRAALLTNIQGVQTGPDGFEIAGVQRPSDIVAYDRIRSTPIVLALVLGILAVVTVANALFTAVRRRQRDLAMLSALGLTRRQVSATVAWQATTFGVLALLIGIPLGIIGGRWAWGFLAGDLGTLSEPKVPVSAVLLAIPLVLLLVNAVAFVPGRMAARLRPAVVLRSE